MGSGAEEPLFSWLTRFCAYRERCIKEVRWKLQSKGFMGEAAEEFIIKLQEQGYLNEERYAVLFAGGHFRQKQWGRRKIEAALRAKGIPAPVIRNALNELSASEYRQTLFRLTEKIWRQQARYPPAIRWARVRAALLRRGYEPEKMTEARQHLATLEKKTGAAKKITNIKPLKNSHGPVTLYAATGRSFLGRQRKKSSAMGADVAGKEAPGTGNSARDVQYRIQHATRGAGRDDGGRDRSVDAEHGIPASNHTGREFDYSGGRKILQSIDLDAAQWSVCYL
jgi:regulatory protein